MAFKSSFPSSCDISSHIKTYQVILSYIKFYILQCRFDSSDVILCFFFSVGRYYSASIIRMSGVKNDQVVIWLAAAVAFVNFSFTLVGVYFVEKLGRRMLALISMAGKLMFPCGWVYHYIRLIRQMFSKYSHLNLYPW